MEVLNGSTMFWLLSFGMLTGLTVKFVMGNRGVGLVQNVLWGTVGTVVSGAVAIALQLPGSLVFAFLGTLGILFILNVFHAASESDSHETTKMKIQVPER